MRSRKTKQIAPRLENGDCRERNVNQLPPDIREALKRIARMENRSVSWVIEQCLIYYFDMPMPEYKNFKMPRRHARKAS